MMEERGIGVLGLAETWWPESGEIHYTDYEFSVVYSGTDILARKSMVLASSSTR